MTYYDAFIGSYLNYACTVWGGTASGVINSLSIVLKRCTRSILDADTNTSHTPLFKKLNWLPFSLYLSYRRYRISFRAINDLAPSYIKNMFS